ncbi:hypothetical protein ACFWFJ_21305, partial [Nocardia salmonicida]
HFPFLTTTTTTEVGNDDRTGRRQGRIHPHEFRLDRDNFREHIAFGRGVHTCPGGPLARVEGRVSIERILDRLLDIEIDADRHGPVGARTYGYEPTFLLRGLSELHINFTSHS